MAYAWSANNFIYFNTTEAEEILILNSIRIAEKITQGTARWMHFLRKYYEEGEALSSISLAEMNSLFKKENKPENIITLRPTKTTYLGAGQKNAVALRRKAIYRQICDLGEKELQKYLQVARQAVKNTDEIREFENNFDLQKKLFAEYKILSRTIETAGETPCEPRIQNREKKLALLQNRRPDPLQEDQPEIPFTDEQPDAHFPELENISPFPEEQPQPEFPMLTPVTDQPPQETSKHAADLAEAIDWMKNLAALTGHDGPVKKHIRTLQAVSIALKKDNI